MMKYAASRMLLALPTILISLFMIFFMIRLIPGDPAQIILGDVDDAGALQRIRTKLGLDQPLIVQFLLWLRAISGGDFGRSIALDSPVGDLLFSSFSVTALLVIPAVVIAALLAVPAGMFSAWRHNTHTDAAVVAAATAFLSIPSFWLGLIVMLVFGVKLDLLPVVGYVSPFDDFVQGIRYLIMPVMTLALVETGVFVRLVRSSTIEVKGLEYITHARAKGLPELLVARRHAFPNVMGPTWTMMGLALGGLLGGAVVIETVFSLPGLGRLMVEAVFARDYPVIQGCMVVIVMSYVFMNLVFELTAPIICPAVRYS